MTQGTATPEGALGEEELQKRAYEAVKSATGWLTDRRMTADSEGYQPYSDAFTRDTAGDMESGFMSSAEGMTALFQVIQYTEREDTTVYFTPQIGESILTEDIEWILNKIEETGYPATPYLPEEATVNFTDAVSFTTTTLQEALRTDEGDVSDERLESALEDIADWFLDNTVESISDDHDGVGWAWCGANEMDEKEYDYPPQTYFTYSGAIGLTDLYLNDRIDTPQEEIADTLSRVIKGLVADYWVEGIDSEGWTEFTARPFGQDLLPNTYNDSLSAVVPDPFSTCNTLMVLAYMWNRLPDEVWENAELTDEEEERIPAAIDFALDRVNDRIDEDSLHEYTTEYTVEATVEDDRGKRQVDYFDGTLPYTAMNAMSMVAEADGPFDYRSDDIEETKLKAIDYILDKCWDRGVGDIGFNHFDPDREGTPAVMYATQIAIESLLSFGLQPPEEGVKAQAMKKIEETKVEIEDQLNATKAEIDDLLENGGTVATNGSGASANTGSDLLSASGEFTRNVMEARRNMEATFDDVYAEFDSNLKTKTKNEARSNADDNLSKEMQDVHIDEFLETLTDCYYASSVEDFRDALDSYEYRNWILVWKPHREAIEDLQAMSDDEIMDFRTRANAVSDVLAEFSEDILDGEDAESVADDFNEREF